MSKQIDTKSKETDSKKTEPENIEPIVINIRGKRYKLPEHLEYEQYYLSSKCIDEADIDFAKFINFSGGKKVDNLKIGMEIMSFLNTLVKADILPKFFSLILQPLDDENRMKDFDKDLCESYEPDMRKMTDVDIMEVAQSFFVGRGILMGGGLNLLSGFNQMKKN